MAQDVSHLPYPDGPAKTLAQKTDLACNKYLDGLIAFHELKNHLAFLLLEITEYSQLASFGLSLVENQPKYPKG